MENEIRPADKPIRECLLPDSDYNNESIYDSEEYELQKILRESREAFEVEEQERWIQEPSGRQMPDFSVSPNSDSAYETELERAVLLSKQLQEEKELREIKVAFCKIRFTQFMQIDRRNRQFYAEMVYYIEKYESGDLVTINIGDENHTRLCHILNNMRITPEDKSNLLQILIR